jgi:hypothetical protein
MLMRVYMLMKFRSLFLADISKACMQCELHLLRKKINPHTHTLFFVYKNLKEFCFLRKKRKIYMLMKFRSLFLADISKACNFLHMFLSEYNYGFVFVNC